MTAMETQELPTVVIVGLPNVGKSTLFNRIIGEQAAIVENRPGVTRDRKELEAEWLGVPFRVIDTGGWMPSGSDLDDKVSRQVEAAVEDADLVLFIEPGGRLTHLNPSARRALRIAAQARVGNVYVNRNMIGAVVGVQPFGGEGLSGTGPKAGGPHYLYRFCAEQTLTINTAAAGGNAELLAGLSLG